MSDALSSLESQTFEIIAYVFPGTIFVIAVFNLVFDVAISQIFSNFISVMFAGFIFGLGLHSVYNLVWKLLRRSNTKAASSELYTKANDLIKEKYNIDDATNLELYFVKERILVDSTHVTEYYNHLSYQKIFSSSFAINCFFIALVLLTRFFTTELFINLDSNYIYIAPRLVLLLAVVCIVAGAVFFNRANFYRDYRNSVLNANVLFNLSQNDL
ncbi:MAG: hypothetical protein AAGF07_01665 [Patescibacteria group bacterium]